MKIRPVKAALAALPLALLPALPTSLAAQDAVAVSTSRASSSARRAPFPAESYAVVSFQGLGACREAANDSKLLELIRTKTSEIAGFDPVDALVVEALPQLEAALSEVGIRRRDMRDLLRSPMQLGVSRVSFFGEDPFPGLALAIDTSELSSDAIERLNLALNGLLRMENTSDALSLDERTIEGVQARVLTNARQVGSVAVGMVDRWLIGASSEHYFAEIVRTSKAGTKTVFDTKGYRWANARQAGSNLASIWLNTGPLYDALGLLLPYESDPILEALGLNRLNGMYVGMDAMPNSGAETLRIAADHTEDGLLAALVQPGLDMSVARYLPPETLLYAGAKVDTQMLISAVDGLFQALPKPVRAEMLSELSQMDEELGQMGMSRAQIIDTIAQFGSQIAFGVATSSNPIPDGYMFVGTRRAGFVDQLAAILEQQEAPIKSQEVRGRLMYFMSLPMDGVRLTPAICEVDGGILVATSPLALKGALARAEGERPSLAQAEDFKARMAQSSDAAAMMLLRLETVGADLYKQYLPLLRGLVESQAPEGLLPEDLPTAEEMRGAMADICTTVSRDRGGISVRTESFLSTGALLGMIGGLVDEVMSTDLERNN